MYSLSDSRSSSPDSPDSDPASASTTVDLDSWYSSLNPDKALSPQSSWQINHSLLIDPTKFEDNPILGLDDLLQRDAYEDSPSIPVDSSLGLFIPKNHQPTPAQPSSNLRQSLPSLASSIPATKAVPPPTPLPRKHDSLTHHPKVVRPPKESCYNLPIMFPSIPENGTKSRVETQIRITVDLADTGSSMEAHKYDRVGSWKWLRLPPGTSTKRRTRKQGKIDVNPEDTLNLSVIVTCSSPPHNRVLSCSSCQAREAKRVAKKIAARVRPARSDSDSCNEDATGNNIPGKGQHRHEDTTSIVQFNCSEVADFSTGTVVLPLRITCYCRHHREKVGFNVHFTMMDHYGRIVGAGSTKPIMITDDHKTATPVRPPPEFPTNFTGMELEWSQVSSFGEPSQVDIRAPSKRKQEASPSSGASKKRSKPYDSSAKPVRVASRETSVSSAPSPATSSSTLPPMTRSPTPPPLRQALPSNVPPLHYPSQDSESSPESLMTPIDHSTLDISMFGPEIELASAPSASPSVVTIPSHPHPMPHMFFDPTHASQSTLSMPTIHRLIPSCGPTHGGIEVTVLGANFYPAVQLTCIFGDTPASSTQRWSDNALVCILPPRATPGIVAVWFDGFQQKMDSSPPSLFTYSHESDRALMELALQVVGLKMTGKIEDAKNVAMRIVNGGGASDHPQSTNNSTGSDMMQIVSSTVAGSSTVDLRPLLLIRAGENEDFESLIVDFLSIIDTPLEGQASTNKVTTSDAISHPTASGQTLLHLASFLGFSALVRFLVLHGIDLDVRDRNGFTALHFAGFSKANDCLKILLEAGADREIVDNFGKTAEEISADGMFDEILTSIDVADVTCEYSKVVEDDDEAQWGDGEDEADEAIPRTRRRAGRRSEARTRRKTEDRISRPHTPSSPPEDASASDKARLEIDEKHAASFIEIIQRGLAQLPGSPQLPLHHLPHLPQLPQIPGMPAAWNALPQIPIVFPVVVPMPDWSALLPKDNDSEPKEENGEQESKGMGAGALRAAQEWRATWEKFMAPRPRSPPPMYTPRIEPAGSVPDASTALTPENKPPAAESNQTGDEAQSEARQPEIVGYSVPPVTEQEVDAYGYEPRQHQKKHDRMLILFWIPILILSLMWAFHHGVLFAMRTAKTAFPLKTIWRN